MKHLILIGLLFLGLGSIEAQTIDKAELAKNIEALIPMAVNDTTPGLIVGVVHKGELIFSKGYGLANLAYGTANNPNMVYNTGSVSKQFLGYAFAMLAVDGKLNLDDPVSQYLDNWPSFKHEVTLRHLLSHTSGYREAYTMSNLAGRIIGTDKLSREECLNVVRKQPELEFVPGSRYTYNSTAWVILAEVLKKVTGEEADQWVSNNILKPLNMNDTQIESYVGEVIKNAAESYSHSDKGYTNEKSNRAIFGAAEIYSNIPDLMTWVMNYDTAEIGGKAVNKLFLDPFILNNGKSSGYALGIGVGKYKGLTRYRHTGGHEAFATQLSYFPEHQLGLITISNYGGKGWLATSKIADLILGEYMKPSKTQEDKTVKVAKKKLKQFVGHYISEKGNDTALITLEGDSLRGDNEFTLIPTSKNTFRVDNWNGKIKFDTSNKETTLTITDGDAVSYHQIDSWETSKSKLHTYEGDFFSEELETTYHLKVTDGKLSIHHRWLGEIELMPFANDVFKTNWGYHVMFNRDAQNQISGLTLNSGRTLNVKFDKQ
ncbi:MAG: hypothetical protein BM564_01680 [Bacteroidetes bacterium MedPE-SWsnd-G2]|nr:MAG: hypothetical protein BM564_01680 [Bacteroidetes bacterium MedPE-SWsnd-G2]